MLLHHFTWQQFLVAATILTAVWYVVVILIFYRKKLQHLLNGNRKLNASVERLRHAWEDDFEDEPDADDLIGDSVLPEGMSKVSMSMFGFAPRVDEPESEAEIATPETGQDVTEVSEAEPGEDVSRERQQRLVPDAIEELKTIFHILERDNGGKEHFIFLFARLKSKYAELRGTPSARALNGYIRENVLFPITEEELTDLWN